MTKTFPLEFEKADDRTKFIKENADLYAITWYSDYKYNKYWYSTLEKARRNAKICANFFNRHIMIYEVMFAFSENHGPDSWIETVIPNVSQHNSTNVIESA